MPTLDVLVPTCGRQAGLAVTLATLVGQTMRDFRVVVADQGDPPAAASGEVLAVVRVLRSLGHELELHERRPRRGVAEQRQFLLDRARAPYAVFLDDDLVLEPDVLERLLRAVRQAGCGFVGAAPIGLSFVDDVRPHQQAIELIDGAVEPELVRPDTPAWARADLHRAANLLHVQQRLRLPPAEHRLYRVAWVGGCVLYDVAALRACGGFGFWRSLPREHAGEDVLAQIRVAARFGGAGVIPSGVYHQELPTTVRDRRVDAPRALPLLEGEDEESAIRAGVRP